MSLLNPWALFWISVVAPVILMYFLKLKRKKVPVSSTWLWARSIQDIRVNAPFQKLRSSLLLFLQILLILLATFALSDPIGRTTPPDERRWVFLIDRSASMQMRDVKPSRLDKAKETAKALLKSCGPRDEVMVVAFSNRAQVLTPLTSDRTAIERAIDAAEPADTVTRIQEAYRIAASAVQPYKSRTIVILSDGRFEPLQTGSDQIDLKYVPIGAEARNAAITAIEVRRPQKADEPYTVFAQLDLFAKEETELPVELHVNGELKAIKKVRMAPNSSGAVIFEISKPDPQIVEVKIAMDDDLDVDNRAWAVVRPDRPRLLIAGTGNFFLEKALAQVRDMDAFSAEDFSKTSMGDYDIVVLHGILPENLPEGRYLILGELPKWEGLKAEGELAQPAVVDWDRRHPVARMVNFNGLYVKSAPKIALPPFASALVEAPDNVPLVFSYEKGRTRAVVVTFKLLDSDWPLRLSFPLFLSNALDWLREDRRGQIRPGEALRIRLAEDETEVEVAGPGGHKAKLTGESGRDVVYGDTDRCGLYTVTRKKSVQRIALNLLDPQESRGTVEPEIKTVSGQVTTGSAIPPVVRPYWRWLALGVFALLVGEWIVYHRRIEI
ncbi:MAG TPA: BatA and WFA domain-containing protein [Planctomycetota bacterium]|nr:BatA and WFA domain-containing protein [Planctomycetota bacterium]